MPITRDALNKAMSDSEREQREESATRRLLNQAKAENERLEALVDILTAIDSVSVEPSRWAQPPRTSKSSRAVCNLMLSDLHLDEVVKPEQMRYRNAYDRQIAELRLKNTVERTIRLARDYTSGITFEGIQVWWNGDTLSGDIHDELKRTNAGQSVIDSIDYWVDHIADALSMLADHFGHAHVVVSYGNHGRTTFKPEAKDAVRSSTDWLIARIVKRALASDERITWNIPEAVDVRETIYSTAYLMTHGDDFKGGDQIAGAIRPVMMADYRMLVVEVTDGVPYDILLVGHFHQYQAVSRAILNGSLIGYNEYAARKKFRPEPPKQAWWVETPENGPMFHTPILPRDVAAEGWACADAGVRPWSPGLSVAA